MARALAASQKPFLTKEIYTSFPAGTHDISGLEHFFDEYYSKAFAGGGTGIIVQNLHLIEWSQAFKVSWLSASGEGNRNNGSNIEENNLPNWCDSTQPLWPDGPYGELFAGLYRKWMKRPTNTYKGEMPGEILVSGLDADEIAFLEPENPTILSAKGMRVAQDGTMWIVGLKPAVYRLFSRKKVVAIHVHSQVLPERATYSLVQRVNV